MRPIKRGSVPLDSHGAPKVYKHYQDAKADLTQRLGWYCAYCERRIDTNLAIEHIKPRVGGTCPHPELELAWDNFLLACTNCNSIKDAKCIDDHSGEYYVPNADGESICQECGQSLESHLSHHYWPHCDNTFRAFQYLSGGRVRVNPALTESEQARAQATLDLTGLDRTPRDLQRKDMRWNGRREAWTQAINWLKRLQRAKTSPHRADIEQRIIELAKSRGYWSVWMTVFKSYPSVLRRLIDEFEGTCILCFDSQGKPLPRPDSML